MLRVLLTSALGILVILVLAVSCVSTAGPAGFVDGGAAEITQGDGDADELIVAADRSEGARSARAAPPERAAAPLPLPLRPPPLPPPEV